MTNSLIFLFVLIILAFSLHFLHLDFFSTPTIPSNLPSESSPVAPVEIEPIVPKSTEVPKVKELTEQEKQEARILADKLYTKKLAVVAVVLWGFIFLVTYSGFIPPVPK